MFLIHKSCYLAYLSCCSKTAFLPYLLMWWPWTLTFGSQIFRNASQCPNKFFWWKKIATWYIKLCYSSKTAFLHIFGAFQLWTSIFQKYLILPQICLFHWQKLSFRSSECNHGSKTVIFPIFGYLVMLTFDLWTSYIPKCLILP